MKKLVKHERSCPLTFFIRKSALSRIPHGNVPLRWRAGKSFVRCAGQKMCYFQGFSFVLLRIKPKKIRSCAGGGSHGRRKHSSHYAVYEFIRGTKLYTSAKTLPYLPYEAQVSDPPLVRYKCSLNVL